MTETVCIQNVAKEAYAVERFKQGKIGIEIRKNRG